MNILDYLEAAEKAAMKFVADSSKAESHNFAEMRGYLDLAEEISATKIKAEKLMRSSALNKSSSTDLFKKRFPKEKMKETVSGDVSSETTVRVFYRKDELPCYFVVHSFLVKIGRSNEGNHLYRKNVPISSVEESLRTLFVFAKRNKPFALREVLDVANGPSYRMQITFSALLELGQFKNTGRGIYEFCGDSPSPQKWLDMLEELPIREDLLEKFEN